MQVTKDSNDKLALRRVVKETVLLGVVFLIALALFFTTVHFIATREAAYELKNRPWGLGLGWLTTITIGLILGRTRQKEESVSLPKSIFVVRESLQAIMLLLFCGVLSYASYLLYIARGLALQRPWGLLIGWFAFLVFIAFFAKTLPIVRSARRKSSKTETR